MRLFFALTILLSLLCCSSADAGKKFGFGKKGFGSTKKIGGKGFGNKNLRDGLKKDKNKAEKKKKEKLQNARKWETKSGKSVNAELVSVNDDGTVTLKRSDGRKAKVPLSKLSEEDVQYINGLASN